jgi:hypothetical protein
VESMKIKYSPCKSNKDTEIKVIENKLYIDNDEFIFDNDSVAFPDIYIQTAGKILEAYRKDGELFVTVLRYYTSSCFDWDTGDYHDVIG